jgi:HAD superfamily hydrolase (TIGR01490 family)
MQPKIVFFDMDHTLLDLDCDVSWKEFLIDEGIAPAEERQDMERFFWEYQRGCLNEGEFLEFQLRQFRSKTPEEMRPLLERHFEQRAKPRIYSQAQAAVGEYRQRNTPIVLLTATNEAIAAPLAEHLKFDEMLATRLEIRQGRYSGRIAGPYCIGEKKIAYARECCVRRRIELAEAAYYGDSINDVPVLEAAGLAVAVNPSDALALEANRRRWRIERWAH